MKPLSRTHRRVASLKRQRGFLRLSMLMPRWGSQRFTVQEGFRQNEPGIHLETYDPNSILKRRNLLGWTNWGGAVSGTPGVAPTGWANTAALGGSFAVNGDELTFSVGAGGGRQSVMQTFTLAGGESLTFSADVVAVSGVETFVLVLNAISGFTTPGPGTVAASAGAGRKSITVVAGSAGATVQARLGIGAGDSPVGAASVTLKNPQLEKAAAPTSYQKVTDWNTEFLAAGGDRVTMFQEPACTTPVTAVEQVIGGFISSERGTVRGANVAINGGFDADTNWTKGSGWAIAGGVATKVGGAGGQMNAAVNPLVVNKWYEVTFDLIATTGSGNVVLGTNFVAFTSTLGAKRVVGQALTNGVLGIQGGFDYTIDNLSVRELPGLVATQATAGFKPKLEARVNLLLATEDVENASWLKTNTGTGVLPIATRNYATVAAPDGTLTAQRLQLNKGAGSATTDLSEVYQVLAPAFNNTRKVWARTAAGAANVILGGGAPQSVDTTWRLFTVAAAGAERPRIMLRGGQAPACADSADLLIWHPDLRSDADAGLDIPAYQRVNTATDYDTEGFPHRCRGDGNDDYLAVPLNMSTVNAVDVWMSGNLKQSDAASQVPLEFTATSSTTAGSFGVVAPNVGTADIQFRSGGTVPANAAAGSLPGPLNAVVAASADIPAPLVVLNVNGTERQSSAVTQGAGNYANDTLYILRRGGSTLPSAAGWCALTIRGGRADARYKARMLREHARLSKIKL